MTPALFGASWIRIASPHFEIYTDSGERTARRVLTRFEQAHRVLSSIGGKAPAAVETRILLFSSARDYATVRPAAHVPAFYQSGPDRDYIVMSSSGELDRIILHEYTHLILNHTWGRLPQWLEEGLADFYSTMDATIGAPVEPHVMTLARTKWLTADQLASVTQKSEYYNEAAKTGIFYAQSWALAHMLILGDPYRGKLTSFMEKLSAGDPPDQAFRASFGRSWQDALADLPGYVRRGFRTAAIDVPPPDQIVFSEITDLDPASASQTRGEILLLMGRDREAQRIYEELAERYPGSPAAQTGLAVIAMRDHDPESARLHFEKAIELGDHGASTYFEYAMLLRDTGANPELVTQFLEKAVAANPNHAEAHFLLGIRASDAERYSDAITHLRRAVEVLPRQAYFWQALSFASYKLGNLGDARAEALRALNCASTDHELDMARAALKLTEEPARSPATSRKGVVTPDGWNNPKGDRSVSGTLAQVDCEKDGARLHVLTDGGLLILRVVNPEKVTIRGGPARTTLACGPQKDVVVTVEYDSTVNRVTTIEFH